jgi:predicted molibdopterin-dependent oxidoreductase YjgC
MRSFVVVQELFHTKTAENWQMWSCPRGLTPNEMVLLLQGERRVQRFYPAVPPLGETKADYAITAEIAKKLGIESGRLIARAGLREAGCYRKEL